MGLIKCLKITVACLMLGFVGCADIKQVVHVDHDGVGKIVETITVTPRGVRMLQGMAKRTGKALEAPALLSGEALQARIKSLGEVTLVGKPKETKLPDGRTQLVATYAFKNLAKVRFYTAPTMAYNNKRGRDKVKRTGSLIMDWNKGPHTRYGRVYREFITIKNSNNHFFVPDKMVTPAERQKFKRVLPIFLDMLKDFRLRIEVRAPIEDFEERDMIQGLPQYGNMVTIYNMTGEGVTAVPAAILQTIMNEYTGGSLASFGRSMPGVFSTIPRRHHGYSMRFMKAETAPKK